MGARTQVSLDPETQQRAQAKAAEQKVSFAEYVRRLVIKDLGEAERKFDVATVFDLADEGQETDIAGHKGEMIAEAILDVHSSRRGRKTTKLKLKSRRR
jgi:hypothetical protein